jgi:hypothetical protein
MRRTWSSARRAFSAALVISLGALAAAAPASAQRPSFPNAVADARYVVHYPDSVSPETATAALDAFRPIPDLVAGLGFRRTLPDDHATISAHSPSQTSLADPAGDPRFDIYLDPSLTNAAGVSYDWFISVLPRHATDFRTLAHEYFHTVQATTEGMSTYSSWMGESLANWIPSHLRPAEDEVNQNVYDVPTRGLFHDCTAAGDCAAGDEYISRAFWDSFGEYLTVRFGERFIPDLYERVRSLSPPPYGPRETRGIARQALTQELEIHGASLPDVFAAYARASVFPTYGYLAPSSGIFSDLTAWGTGERLDAMRAAGPALTLEPREFFVPPFGLRLVRVSANPRDALRLGVDTDPGVVSVLQTYEARTGVTDIPGGSGATRAFSVPPGSGAERVVRLVLANPTDSAATARISGEARDAVGPQLANLRLPRQVEVRERARIRFALDEAGRVAVEIRRCRGSGTGAGCRGASSLIGEVSGAGDGGSDSLRFSSRLGRRLRPGDHEAVAVATDAAGNVSGEVTRGFEVVK